MNEIEKMIFWRVVLALTAVFVVSGLIQMVQTAESFSFDILHSLWIYLIITISSAVGIVLALLGISWTQWRTYLLAWPEAIARLDKPWKIAAGLGYLTLPIIFSIAILHPYLGTYYFSSFFSRLALFWCLALPGMFCVRIIKKDFSWLAALGISAVLLTVLYIFIARSLEISTYPFSLSWSEISRYYGASLFFGGRIYGQKVLLPASFPMWHFLQSLPYLFGDLPIWIHRAWHIALQLGSTAVVGIVFAKRLNLSQRTWFWCVSAWVFLFLFQEKTVYAHLMICFLIVLLGVSPQRFLRTTLIVLVASIWAGLSRVNWFPVPGLAAALLYFLETPREGSKSWLSYLWKPVTWFLLGTGMAFAAGGAYNQWSGNAIPGGLFAYSFTSDLLWYRLLPNATNPIGILVGALLISLPVNLIIFFGWRRQRGSIHPLRITGVVAILTVLFFGGLVVSIKIGGGSDLHNMDAFLILLMLTGGYGFFNRWNPEALTTKPVPPNWSLAALAIAVPVFMAVQGISSYFPWDRAQAAGSLDAIRDRAVQTASQGGEVLFISQRHLLALGMVDVPLIPEYEQDYLMEMVMSHNRAYLGRFQADLEAQRFGLIVTEKQTSHLYGSGYVFGEENDLWVTEVSIPLLCYYELLQKPVTDNVVLYVPRHRSCNE